MKSAVIKRYAAVIARYNHRLTRLYVCYTRLLTCYQTVINRYQNRCYFPRYSARTTFESTGCVFAKRVAALLSKTAHRGGV